MTFDKQRLLSLLYDCKDELDVLADISNPSDFCEGRDIFDLMSEIQHFIDTLEED